MARSDAPRARRVAVDEPTPFAPHRADYADAFELRLHQPDTHTAEEWARACLEEAPATVRWLIRNVHRHVLRLRLGPLTGPEHIHGWRIAASEPHRLELTAQSPVLGRGVIVGRRQSATSVVVTTFIAWDRPTAARAIWTVIGPLHRWIAPQLLRRAAMAFAAQR